MKPLLPNTYVLNNKYLQSIISPSTDIIDYNFTSEQVHKLNLLQILRPDIYFNKNLSDRDKQLKSVGYEVMQGFVEDSSVMKELAGQLSEYMFGQDANVKMTRFYMRNMSQSIQAANP